MISRDTKLVEVFNEYIANIVENIVTDVATTAWTKYLRKTLIFMWNSALRENFNFYFQGVFC